MTENNVMRTEYRKLNETEVRQINEVKKLGTHFHAYLEGIGASREISLAKTKIEEAVMWAVKHLSA